MQRIPLGFLGYVTLLTNGVGLVSGSNNALVNNLLKFFSSIVAWEFSRDLSAGMLYWL